MMVYPHANKRSVNVNSEYAAIFETLLTVTSENGGGSVGRRYVCDAATAAATAPAATPATATAPAPATAPPAIPQPTVKHERLSPHESNTSRSRSVTPSTSSYPGTPPEGGSPHAPQSGPAPLQPRNYSDIMRSLAARYNTIPPNNYFHRSNGFSTDTRPSTSVKTEPCEPLMGGLFSTMHNQHGGPLRLPAFPSSLDMSSTKTLLAISRLGRSRRKRVSHHVSTGEYSPLDLSAASSENAAKRARLSESPSTRSDNDDRDRTSNEDRSESHNDCLCAEARARLQAWTVDEVCEFVNSIDICAEYSSSFREQRIDGESLPLLTEQHLTKMLQMKLGPALKLRAVVAARLEPCAHCQSMAPVASTSSASQTSPVPSKLNGTSLKTERNASPS